MTTTMMIGTTQTTETMTTKTTSLRWRIVVWMSLVVALALGGVVLMTRSVLFNEVAATANASVEQEIEEFRRFAADATDPVTAEPFDSAERMVEVYLSRQIPDASEVILGAAGGQLIQMNVAALDGTYPEPLAATEPVVREMFGEDEVSGIFENDPRGPVYWGKVFIEGERPVQLAVAYFTGDALAAAKETLRSIVILALGGLVASIVIAWLIAGQIVAPVRQVSRVASQISNSDLTQRVPVRGSDEIAQLARTFNAMLDRVEDAYVQQRQFVDDAGHELRTPITVIRGQLELLETGTADDRARSIALATAELDRMARMVNDLLTLAVADSGDFVDPQPVDVAELSIDIEDKARTLSERIELTEVAEGTMLLDEHRITEAVLELCNNALRYSDDRVDIGSTYTGAGPDRELRFWVRDRGQGVAVEKQSSLFGRFSRGGTARRGGAGLGLSIVDAIATAHGGRAYVESVPGLGSTFGLALPAATKEEQ